jgi:hypothetical protein
METPHVNAHFNDVRCLRNPGNSIGAIHFDKEGSFLDSVTAGVIETVKHSGVYYDEVLANKGIEPSKITKANATEIMQLCSRAFMELTNDRNVSLAKSFFQILIDKKK